MPAIWLASIAYGTATMVAVRAIAARGVRAARRDRISAQAGCALAAAAIGAAVAGRLAVETTVVAGIATTLLGAVAYAGFFEDGVPSDVICGGLAIVLAAALVHGRATPLIGAAIAGSPFVITALLVSKERLRDGAVAAIGGSLLGIEQGIATAILGAIAGALALSRDPAGSRSLAPYLACAIGFGIAAFALLGT